MGPVGESEETMSTETATCKVCGTATWPPILGDGPAKDICYDCKQIAGDDGEICTDDKARCPKCRNTMSLHDDNSDWYEDGGHDVTCDHCGYDFRIVSSISVSIESPEMLPESERVKP